MVGGRDFEDSKFNRATQALRQPGSTFKPIVYAAAVEAGYPLSHVMVDDPLSVELDPTEPPWAPQNYDLEFDGPMTLRRALYLSRNIIAIKLGMELGEQAVISEATQVRAHHPGAGVPVDSHRLGRRHSAGDDRGLYHLRQSGDPHHSQRRCCGWRTAAARSCGSRRCGQWR